MKTRKPILKVLLSVALLIMVLNLSCLTLAAGGYHTVGIKDDGTVVATGRNDFGQCNVGGWSNITQVAAGMYHTVGIEGASYGMNVTGGTVVATGRNDEGQCNVGGWTDILGVAAGGAHTVGLCTNGTVVATGRNNEGQCEVDGWEDINMVVAGGAHTVGLEDGGTVVATGEGGDGQCDVYGPDWTALPITQVAAGFSHTVGLKNDGTVVATGNNDKGQCDVYGPDWTNIEQVAAGEQHTVGLKEDGTVVATGWNNHGQCNVGGWTNIVLIAAGGWHTAVLKNCGSVAAVGLNNDEQCDVGGWILEAAWFGEPPEAYYLTISSTAGGLVTTPGEGIFADCEGELVNLVATPGLGYQFDNWTGDVGTIADVNAASTTITMNGDYSITANFKMGGCFIATAAYGTPMADEIEILREFRDEYLLTNPLGQALTGLYYRVSPPMAEFIAEHPSLKPIVRAGLLPAVAMSAVAVNTTPAEKIAIIGLVVLVSVALAVWAARRRGRGPQYT